MGSYLIRNGIPDYEIDLRAEDDGEPGPLAIGYRAGTSRAPLRFTSRPHSSPDFPARRRFYPSRSQNALVVGATEEE